MIEQPKNSPEIPETPTVTLEIVRRGEDDHSEDDNTPSHMGAGRPRLTVFR